MEFTNKLNVFMFALAAMKTAASTEKSTYRIAEHQDVHGICYQVSTDKVNLLATMRIENITY